MHPLNTICALRIEQHHLTNVAVLFANARSIGFPDNTFDFALSGFMGWYDCFDFERNEFTQPDTKAPEIFRVLREGGQAGVLFLGGTGRPGMDGRSDAQALPGDCEG